MCIIHNNIGYIVGKNFDGNTLFLSKGCWPSYLMNLTKEFGNIYKIYMPNSKLCFIITESLDVYMIITENSIEIKKIEKQFKSLLLVTNNGNNFMLCIDKDNKLWKYIYHYDDNNSEKYFKYDFIVKKIINYDNNVFILNENNLLYQLQIDETITLGDLPLGYFKTFIRYGKGEYYPRSDLLKISYDVYGIFNFNIQITFAHDMYTVTHLEKSSTKFYDKEGQTYELKKDNLNNYHLDLSL